MVTTKNTVEQKNGTDLKSIPPAVKVDFPKKEEERLQPLDDRLHRLNVLFDLQSKYNRLQDSLKRLNEFSFGKDSDYAGITIRDDNGKDFKTSNPEVTKEVVSFLTATIKTKIKSIEPQLKW
jgi:hypothetical protein